jgi:acyl-CoA reductase-like NAD-dependent aldehyde dehydrogenase
MTIGGARVETRQQFDVVNPATGSVFATAPAAAADDIERAMLAADEAFATWKRDEETRRRPARS